MEVTFHDAKQFLGLEDPQGQAPRTVQRTAPLALIVYALVVLWYAEHGHGRAGAAWLVRPWYPSKTTASFLDMLTALRRAGWRRVLSQPSSTTWLRQNPAPRWVDAVLATA